MKDTAVPSAHSPDLRSCRSFSAAGSLPSCSSVAAPATGRRRSRVPARAERARRPGPRSTIQLESALRGRAEAEALQARADEELAERQKVELALRSSETRYRALAARTGRLHGLASALSEAVTMDAVARAVVRHGGNVLGATNGEVWRLTEDGAQFEMVFSDVSQPGAQQPPRIVDADPGLCATHAVRTEKPVFVASFDEWQERYSTSAALAADGGYVSSATLPLILDGSPAGVLAFYFTAPVNFDEEYQALLISVAQHCAQALERARCTRRRSRRGGGRNRQSPQGRVRLDCLA